MYRNKKFVRIHEDKLRFNDDEDALIEDVLKKTGGQRATLIRQMALREARRILADDAKRDSFKQEVDEEGLLCAS